MLSAVGIESRGGVGRSGARGRSGADCSGSAPTPRANSPAIGVPTWLRPVIEDATFTSLNQKFRTSLKSLHHHHQYVGGLKLQKMMMMMMIQYLGGDLCPAMRRNRLEKTHQVKASRLQSAAASSNSAEAS